MLSPYELIVARPKQRRETRIAYGLLAFMPIFTYAVRYLLYSIANQASWGVLVCLLFPIVVAPLLVTLGCELYFIMYGVTYKNFLPALGAILLFLIATRMPLPVPIPNDTEQNFFVHRAEYEHIVEQARIAPLPVKSAFNAHIERQHPLVVMFDPDGDHYIYIVYAAQHSYLEGTDACDRDSDGHRQLDSVWWICFRDAN